MKTRVFPGYQVALVSTVALVATGPGQTMLVSLLNVPWREQFAIEPLALNTMYTWATILASLPLVWVGKLTDHFGPRRMLVAVALAFSGACAFAASISQAWMVFVAFFLLRFLGQGALALVGHHALAMWFHRRLGTVSGVRSVALFLVWTPLPAVTAWLLRDYGWRFTWSLFGAIGGPLVALLAWVFVRDRPEDLGLSVDGDHQAREQDDPALGDQEIAMSLAQARKTRAYWLLAAAAALHPMIGTAIIFDIQPLLIGRGVNASVAPIAVSIWSAAMALSALPAGRLVDRFAPGLIVAAGTLTMALSCGLMAVLTSPAEAYVGMVLYAVGQSLVGACVGTTAARFFGRAHHGAIRSSLSRIGVIATGMGPLAFGLSHSLTDGYVAALILFCGLCVPVALLNLKMTPPASPNSFA